MLEKVETKAPSMDTLIEWDNEGFMEADCEYHCHVKPDGTCSHGKDSWLLVLGLI